MTASYPSSVKSFTTKVDGVDDVMAVDVNGIQDEVVAIETELGTNPSGSNTTVSERIAAFSSLPGATTDLVTISGSNVHIDTNTDPSNSASGARLLISVPNVNYGPTILAKCDSAESGVLVTTNNYNNGTTTGNALRIGPSEIQTGINGFSAVGPLLLNPNGGSVGVGKSPSKGVVEISGNGTLWGTFGWKRQIELEDSGMLKWAHTSNHSWGIGATGGDFYLAESIADDQSQANSYPIKIAGVSRNIDISGAGDFYSAALTDYSGTSTIVGWSSFTTKILSYKKIGNLVYVWFSFSGTSDNAATTFTLPYANSSSLSNVVLTRSQDNGATFRAGMLIMGGATSTATLYPDQVGSAWTASGTKVSIGQFFYNL